MVKARNIPERSTKMRTQFTLHRDLWGDQWVERVAGGSHLELARV